ncbi:hypothetical protein QRD43_02245 [Pelomonas sp. APW6]|uniref:Uncharacterized protein n=1 Tax=Roseateles subflavus TaxID=3053353 RepID=A0ABT7LCW5_9BURK|nr:hypothetical protein [Pelomonas sp. APW6]MDL5030713.1 hypothetical protein [Pelomonas sp. APW6]
MCRWTWWGDKSLQTSRLPFSMVMQWTVEKPGATLRAPDGSSVTVISYDGARGVAELGIPGRPMARQAFTSADLQAALKRWTYGAGSCVRPGPGTGAAMPLAP